jgi:nitroreductase
MARPFHDFSIERIYVNMTTVYSEHFRKPADATHPVHDLIRERWSPRAFSARPVESEKLHSLFEAARWAPSAGNQQPWNFIIATREHPEDHARFTNILNDLNKVWARNAPVLILTVIKDNDRPGFERANHFDAGMAVGNLLMQAVDLGLVTHQVLGLDAQKAITDLNIPEGYAPHAMIIVGYPDVPDQLPEELRLREAAPRSRKALDEFVFEGSWQQAAPDANI